MKFWGLFLLIVIIMASFSIFGAMVGIGVDSEILEYDPETGTYNPSDEINGGELFLQLQTFQVEGAEWLTIVFWVFDIILGVMLIMWIRGVMP